MDNDGPNARHQHSPQDVEYRRVELITGRRRRRDWTPDEKAEILAASVAPGSKIAEVARRYGVSRGLLWTWRRQAMNDLAAETVPRFVPLRIEDGVAEPSAIASEPAAPTSGRDQPAGSIEIEIGRARVRVEGAVDPEVLRQVLGLIGPAR
ncbi:MAG: IS66-like element accessory protein TnpA [Acidocella sp.]|uniref:IS66-like element accessory protein TnpA n=1 Tax=Acidocella sp. TaxID=50710 RepID=UPI003FC8379B